MTLFTTRTRMSVLAAAAAALAALAVAGLPAALAQTEAAASPESSAEQAEAMQKTLAATQPGAKHKQLGFFVGEWQTTTKIWLGGPGSAPAESKGTSSVRWILGGRYILEEHKGTLMGQPYESTGLTGHDNYRNLYVATWVNNADTQMLTVSGARNPQTGVWTYYGEMDEPALDVRGRMVKYVVSIQNDKEYLLELYDLHAGDGYKAVEIRYERKRP